MADVKPSGPLWCMTDGEWFAVNKEIPSCWAEKQRMNLGVIINPCRLVTGHGKVVPLELVGAIWNAHKQSTDFHIETDCAECEAIRAAIEGAL